MTDQGLGPPPIESLSDAAWSRVERGVWLRLESAAPGQPSPRPERRWILAIGVAAAALIAVGLFARTTDAPITGEPSRVVSGSAPAQVSFGDIHIELDAATALVTSHE